MFERGNYVGDDIVVREHDALGLAGGAGRVDDGGQILGGGTLGQLINAVSQCQKVINTVNLGAAALLFGGCYLIGEDDCLKSGQFFSDGFNGKPSFVFICDQTFCTAVSEDEGQRSWRVDGVQRYGDHCICEHCLVGEYVIDGIVEQNAHTGAARQAETGERLAPFDDAVVEFQVAERFPGVGRTVKLLQGNFAARERSPQGNELIKRGALFQSCKTLRGIVNGSLIRHLQSDKARRSAAIGGSISFGASCAKILAQS